MAELDEKLLKTLDDRLKNILTTMTSLDSVIQTVVTNSKSSLTDLISLFQASGASLTDMLQAFNGNRLADLLGIKDAAGQVKQLNEQIETLNRNTKMGGKASWVEDKDTGRGSWKVLKGDEFKNEKEERDAINALAEARQKLRDLTLSDSQLWEKIVALINKAAVETQKEESAKEREFQKAVKQQEELARKYAELEKLRSEVFGGRSYGKLSGKEKVQWTEMGSSLEKIKKQMEEIEKLSPGSRAKGESIYKEQEAITRAKREAAEEQKRIAKEEAEYEKLLKQEQIQEERRKAAETKRLAKEEADALSEYIRLYREKTGLLKTVSPLDAKVIRNQQLSEQERGLYDASWNRIYAINDEMAKLRANYVSVLEYEEKIQANGQEQVNTKKVQLAQEQALAKEKERQAKSESKQQSDEAKIQKQADAIVKKRIDLERQVQRIDNDRAIRQQTNSKISQQALDAESRKYEALLQRINQLNNALSKLEGKQAGVTARAEQRNAPYMNYVAAAEEERKAKAIENSTKKLKEQKKTLDSMLPTIQRLASAFGIAFSVRGLVQFGKKLIETRGTFEMQFVAMKQIIQDTDAATKLWNQTMQQALKSPFKAMQLVTYTKQLAAYRVETEKLFDTTKRLADISAGLGVDMGRLILAYGQVKSANFLRSSEVRQFTEAGVNIVGNLADYFTELEGRAISTAEVMERISKRMVSFADVEEIFRRMTDEGGEFYNMQEVQANTVRGQIMKLHDAYDQMLNAIGESKQGTIRKWVDRLNDLVRNWRNVVPLIKQTVAVLGTYIAVTKLARLGTQKFGESMVKVKGYSKAMKASLVEERLLLLRSRKAITLWGYETRMAIFKVQMAWKALGSVLKAAAPFLILEGLVYAFNKIAEPFREAIRLKNDLSQIRIEESAKSDDNINNYDKLIKKMSVLNKGSVERKNVIDQINSQYGKYLGFIVDETTALNDLNDARERVVKNIREASRARAEEAAAQRIQEDFISREQKLTRENFAGLTSFGYTEDAGIKYLSGADAAKWTEYYRNKISNLTDEQVREFNEDRNKLIEATRQWFIAFIGYSGEKMDITSHRGFSSLADLLIEEENRIRTERENITLELSGFNQQQQDAILKVTRDVSDALEKLPKAGKFDRIKIDDIIDFVIPTDLGDKEGIFDAIKQEINRRKDDFIIQLKLDWGYITEEQANELRNAAQTTGDFFVDEVNKEITKGILQDYGLTEPYTELVEQIFNRPEEISDWNKVNDAIELINRSLITSSDIINGISSYTKELSANLENGRRAIDDAVRKQKLIVNGTEEEVRMAQEAVDKARERYKWLLRIAKLLGLNTKAVDEIVEEQGYDLSIGQVRLEAIQKAFLEKFGKESNSYGRQLSLIGVTENQKELADAYHKQDEELQGLIKTMQQSLDARIKEGIATEDEIEAERIQIENLQEEQKEAEWLSKILGYVAKAMHGGHKENASRLISLIKEMRSEYDKLSQSAYGYAKSEDKIRESYRDSVKEILGKAGITDYDFTTNEGMIAALRKVKNYATRLGKEAAAEVQKYIDQLETEIEINAQVKIREDFGKQMEEMFNNYELTVELQNLGISEEAAENLFPFFEASTLGQIQDALREFYESQGENFDEQDLEAYRRYAEKIDNLLLKSRKQHAKDYSKYLEKELSERAKLEMQYAKDVAFVTANFFGEQRENILQGLQDKFQQDLSELVWKSFKESSFYVEMMDDLSSIPMDYMQLMLGKIEELLQNPETLSPRALKEAINARQKILDAQMDYSQISVMRNSMRDIRAAARDESVGGRNWIQTRRNLEEQITLQAKEIAEIEEEIRCYEELQGQLKGLETVQKDVADANMALAEETVADLERTIGSGGSVEDLMTEYSTELEELQSRVREFHNNEASATTEQKEANAQLERRISDLRQYIQLLGQYKEALDARAAYQSSERGQSALAAQASGETSSSVGANITELRGRANNVTNRLSKLKQWQKAFSNFNNAFTKFNQNASDMVSRLGALSSAAFDLYEALGGETDAMTEAWKEFGSTITTTITEALTMIPQLVAGFVTAGTTINAAMGIIGLIAEAIQLVLVLISGLSKLHDASYQQQIDNEKERIDELTNAYERLEKQIEKTWDSVSYMKTYSDMEQNILQQIQSSQNQIAAYEDMKKNKSDEIKEEKENIQDLEDELEELRQKQIEVLGGIGTEGYRDAAQGFVDAWKTAFLETGDGLQDLQDHFDEFLNDWFVKQATMRIAGKTLEPLFRDIDNAVARYGDGGTDVMMSELQKVFDRAELVLPDLSDKLAALAGTFGLGGEGSLSGLAAGIQGMTEEQANILEAYWNSVRGNTENIDLNVSRIAQILGAGGDNANPMLAQMTLVAQNTTSINRLLGSVVQSSHPMGGFGIRVFAN